MIGASSSLRWEPLLPLWLVVLVIVPVAFLVVRSYRREAGRAGRRLQVTVGLLRAAALRRYRVGDSVGVEAKFLDREFEPVQPPDGNYDNFERKIKLRTLGGDEQEITLTGIETKPPEGIFRTKLHAGEPGTYRLIAESDGSEQPAEETFIVESTTIEMSDPLMDIQTLNGIAKASGGRVLMPDKFRGLLDDEVLLRKGGMTRTPLWDRSWMLWAFVGLLAIELVLRRAARTSR